MCTQIVRTHWTLCDEPIFWLRTLVYMNYFFFLLIFCHLHNETLQLLASTELELILCCMLWRAQCLTVYYSSSLFTFRLTEEERTFGKRNIEHQQQQNVKSHTLSLGMGLRLGRDIRMIYTMKCVQVI